MIWDAIRRHLKSHQNSVENSVQPNQIWVDSAQVDSKIRELVADELKVDINRVTPDAHWYKDFGCSLDVVEVFMRCEEEFGVEIPDEDAEQCETVGKLTRYIQNKLGLA